MSKLPTHVATRRPANARPVQGFLAVRGGPKATTVLTVFAVALLAAFIGGLLLSLMAS